jgi:putative transposase
MDVTSRPMTEWNPPQATRLQPGVFVRVFPTTSAAQVVREVKGLTSHELRKNHPVLLRLPSLWTRSYFAATAGNVSEETIRRYIEAQKGV